jgi:zinc protease
VRGPATALRYKTTVMAQSTPFLDRVPNGCGLRPLLPFLVFLLPSCFACASPPAPVAAAPPPPALQSIAAPPASGTAPAPEPTTPDAPFRAGPPAPAGTIVWTPPHIESWSMPNGVRVLFVPRRDTPIVAVRVVGAVGAGDLPGVRPGAVAFMGSMLEQGAGGRDALQVSDDYEALGAEHSAWCDFDACAGRVKVLSSRLGPALDLLADVVLRPAFPAAEIERARKRWLGSLQQEKSSPPAMEQNAIAAAVYGRAHPYGHSLRGTPADIAVLARDEVERAWRMAFQPKSTTIVVSGDVDLGALRVALESRFGAWRALPADRRAIAPLPPAPNAGLRVVLVDVPEAAQSQVVVAQRGAPFGAGDRIALSVMNAILGGMFSSRINLELREARGYTYGARSRFSMRHTEGPFTAGGAIFAEHTGDAARAIVAQITRVREEAVTAEELADAKENARLALPARFEGVDDVAGALQDIAVYGLPLDEYDRRSAQIDAVTVEDVQRAAKKWLHPEAMVVVVAGDRARVEKDLSSLGPIELRDAYGDPVK